MSEKNIALNNVTQVFRGAAMRSMGGEFRAVDDVSFNLNADPPQIISLVGQSGSGKSTIARIILGLQRPTGGCVTYGGKDIYKLSGKEYDVYRKEVQPVFQDPYSIFNPFYRVDRVFWTAINKFKLASSKQQGLAKIEESLHAVDLRPEDVLNRYPHQLSGGQRQPVSMLDAAVRVLFLNILIDFTQKYGMTTLFITHDLSTAYYVGGEIMVISSGKIVESGNVEQVLVKPSHPYTQMLLASIPIPDPDARWTEKPMLALEEEELVVVEQPDLEVFPHPRS
jgi:peptide/nickel transport system ATP-binding protein